MMRGLWLEDRQLSYRDDLPVPTPPQGEALVKVRLGGVCATDLEMVQGYYPFRGVPGHEFVGEIAAPAPDGWQAGQRVVGEINATCGKCRECRSGRSRHCARRTVLGILGRHGAFAEYLSLPLENLHRVPEEVPDEVAVFTEPLAAALEVVEQVAVLPEDRVLVVGAGRLGQLVASVLALTGCDLHVLARSPRQVELLQQRGIGVWSAQQVPERSLDIAVEASGSPAGFEIARRALRPRGTLVLKSTYAGDLTANFSAVVVDEITLIGSRCGPFPPAIELFKRGVVDPRPLIDGRYRLEQGLQAFELSAQRGKLKVLLETR